MAKALYNIKPIKEINCPQCGYPLPIYFLYTKLVECPSCHSNIFLEDEVAKVIGTSSALSPEPSLIELYKPFKYQTHTYMPVGKIRYNYGRGFWEEFFLKRDDSEGWWMSIDEGDFALEKKDDISTLGEFNLDDLRVGRFIKDYMVTEMGSGKVEGFSGEIPEPIELGMRHNYIHLSGKGSELLTIEYDDLGKSLFRGNWIDPFLIERL